MIQIFINKHLLLSSRFFYMKTNFKTNYKTDMQI